MEEGEVMGGGGGTKQRERKAVEREASGVIEKGFDSPCAPPMKITTLSYGHGATFAREVGWETPVFHAKTHGTLFDFIEG